MATKIQLRGDTLANWTSENPILSEREMVIETDNYRTKIGNGTDHYNDLPYSTSTPDQLDIEITGTFAQEIYFLVQQLLGRSVTTGRKFTSERGLVLIQDVVYDETGLTPSLESIKFHNLVFSQKSIGLNNCTLLESIEFPALLRNLIGASISPASNAALTTIDLSSLESNEGTINPSSNPLLTDIILSSLTSDVAGSTISPLGNASLATMSFPALLNHRGDISPAYNAVLTTIDLSRLVNNYGTMSPSYNPLLTTIDLSQLVNNYSGISPANNDSLTVLSFPSLVLNNGSISPGYNAILTTLDLSAVTTSEGGSIGPNNSPLLIDILLSNLVTWTISGNLAPYNCNSLTTLDLPALETCDGFSIQPSGCNNLVAINLPNLISWTNSGLNIGGVSSLQTIKVGTIGTLKTVDTDLTLNGQALTEACVDDILAVFATLDGTNGTTLFTHTIDLSGGTSSAPSVAGAANAAIIIANGGTVITN